MALSLLSLLAAFEHLPTQKAPTFVFRALKHAGSTEALPVHPKDGLILNDLDLSPVVVTACGSYQLTVMNLGSGNGTQQQLLGKNLQR